MLRYSVKENVGPNGITLQAGQRVYDAIYPQLSQHQPVELDFADVRIVASPFLNAAVGQLLRDLSSDDLNAYLKIVNLSSVSRPILKRVIENAKQYYTSESYREAVNAMLQERGENGIDN